MNYNLSVLIDKWLSPGLKQVVLEARATEGEGFDALWVPETTVDPFLPTTLAAEHTDRIALGIGVAIAFARNPMTVAQAAWNLQDFSQGRLLLGLGSQIRAHIEKRYSMPWSSPAARMREFVLALRTIWHSWQTGERLNFTGDLYTHTLMTPFFDPGPIESPPPKVFLAAVGVRMTQVAGEVADGMLVHSFCTPSYVESVTLPALHVAFERNGRSRQDFQLSQRVFVVTGADDAQFQEAKAATRRQIAFYGSTPAYRPVLDHHGWGDLQTELNTLSKRGEWDAMSDLIDDGILDELAVVAPPRGVAKGILDRVGGLIDRVTLYAPYELDPSLPARVLSDIRELGPVAAR
jgi:probable F420-dependent oxidoreductase